MEVIESKRPQNALKVLIPIDRACIVLRFPFLPRFHTYFFFCSTCIWKGFLVYLGEKKLLGLVLLTRDSLFPAGIRIEKSHFSSFSLELRDVCHLSFKEGTLLLLWIVGSRFGAYCGFRTHLEWQNVSNKQPQEIRLVVNDCLLIFAHRAAACGWGLSSLTWTWIVIDESLKSTPGPQECLVASHPTFWFWMDF